MNTDNRKSPKGSAQPADREKGQPARGREGMSSVWRSVALMSTVGWSIALPAVAGAWFGHWLDKRLGSGYLFLILFLFLGFAAGVIAAWRMVVEKR